MTRGYGPVCQADSGMEYPQRNAKNQGGYSAAGQAQRRIQSFLESAELVLVRTCRPAQGANNSPWGKLS